MIKKTVGGTISSSLALFCFLLTVLAVTKLTVVAQQSAARPDPGTRPTGAYAVSDIESIDLINGNLSLRIPLASLPPIVGGRLSYGLTAVYNSKIWNVTREEQIQTEPPEFTLVRDNPQLADFPGWRIAPGFNFVLRDSREDFDWVMPNCDIQSGGGDDPDCGWFKQGSQIHDSWHKWYFVTPDGAEHEMKPVGFTPFTGSRGYLWGYYKETPGSVGGPMTFYSFDGSYIWVKANPTGNAITWEACLPDGTRIVQRNNGIQRITDPNGNQIVMETTFDGAGNPTLHIRDAHTGREIKKEFIPGTDGRFTERIWYQTVGGGWQAVDVGYKPVQVFGKTYDTTLPPQLSGDPCTLPTNFTPATIEVVETILLPTTETGVERKFEFTYTTEAPPVTVNLPFFTHCDGSQLTITQASNGWGGMSRMTTPSGAMVDYTYSLTNVHELNDPNNLARERVLTKSITHDGITENWDYSNGVLAPDGSHTREFAYPQDSGWPGNYGGSNGLGGLVFKIDYPGKRIVERRWIRKMFDTANAIVSNGQQANFNAVVSEEYVTLVGNPSKMTARTMEYDFNGNLTRETQYDWFDPNLVTRDQDTANLPQGVPAGVQKLREITYTHHNAATLANSSNVYAKRLAGDPPTPFILNAVKETTAGDGSTVLSRTQFHYDDQGFNTAPIKGNLTRERRQNGTAWIETQNAYDTNGNRISTTDPKGNITQFFYEDITHAQPTRIVADPDPQTASDEHTTTAVYDFSTGLVTSQTDPNGAVTVTEYVNNLLGGADPFGRPGKVIGPPVTTVTDNGEFPNEKREALTKYFDNPRQVEVISDLSRQGDQKLKSRTSHDELGRVVKVENSEDGTSYTIFAETVYREMGRITFTSNPRRAGAASTDGWTRITNDALGRAIEVATFSGAALPPNSGTSGGNWTGSVTTVYNANETMVTDQAGKSRKSEADGLGRLAKVIEDPGGSAFETNYSYDALGNLRFVNQGTQEREFTYDGLSRLLSAKNPEQVNGSGVKTATTYEYDDASNLKKRTNPNGATVDFTYDGLNRVKTKTLSGGPVYTFGYDSAVNGKGRLASVTVAGGDGFYYDSFDKAGKVLQTRQLTTGQGSQFSYTMSYGYDLAGNMSKEVYPSGRTIKMGYDGAGRLNRIAGALHGQNKDYVKSASYTAHGAVSGMVIGNDLTENTGFNSRLQPTAITVTSSPTVTLFDLSYKYGVLVGSTLDATKNNGNVQSQEIKIGSTVIKQSYSYDALNRLTSATETLGTVARWTQSYEYDRYGNRTLLTNTGVDAGLLPTQSTPGINDATNRLVGFSYDTSGNVLGDGVGNTFTYDAENRQLTHTRAGTTTSYVYDGEGRRVKKESSGVTTIFVYNAGSQLIAEYTTDPVPPPVGGGGTSYLTTDHLGSTRLVTDQNRNVKSRRDYCPFGEELGSGIGGRTSGMSYGQADGLRQRFTGKERDAESGLDYFLARYYSSWLGRFLSADPENAGAINDDPQSWNGFAYSRNNPVMFVDLDGLKYVLWIPETGYSVIDDWLFQQEQKTYRGYGFTFTGSGKFFESGSIFDAEGKFVGSYEQISIDDNLQAFAFQMSRRARASKNLIGGYAIGTAVVGATGGAAAHYFGSLGALTTLGGLGRLAGPATAGGGAVLNQPWSDRCKYLSEGDSIWSICHQ